MPTLYVLEHPPEHERQRWYCHLDGETAPPFEDVDEAVEWARSRSFDVIVRTLGGLCFSTTEARSDADELPWPPTSDQRRVVDADYRRAVANAESEAAAQAVYEAKRDELIGRASYLSVVYSGTIELEDGQTSLLIEELSEDAELSGGRRRATAETSFGALPDVIAKLAHLERRDPWVVAVLSSLERDRRAGHRAWRRPVVSVRRGAKTMYHVSDQVNRASICGYGLDWTRMLGQGIAGSRVPEREGVFLCDDEHEVDFFVRMARSRGVTPDVWAVNVDDCWVENGPSGWWIVFEAIQPDRIRLVSS